jgi:general L-amino acid transport system permease protein
VFEVIPSRLPPPGVLGVRGWLRANLFSSPANTLLTVVTSVVLVAALANLITFIFFDASWAQVWRNLKLLGAMAGVSPNNKIARGAFFWISGFVAVLAVLAVLFWPSVRLLWPLVLVTAAAGFAFGRQAPRLAVRVLPVAWALWLLLGFFVLYGVQPGSGLLRIVPARDWGGFLLTLILFTGIIPSFPLGVALALGRRSRLPAIKVTCIVFIEVVRGAPLIMWLFIASLLLPLLLNTDPNNLPSILRAYVAITLFSSAYMAENVRGGLQAVPRGQGEAARALGLNGWQTMRLIVLPQALRAVIPAIVGQAIGLFKDTSLVFIVGLADFFRVAELVSVQPASLLVTGGVKLEVYLFVAAVYFFFAYRMSAASRQLEKQLGVGTR